MGNRAREVEPVDWVAAENCTISYKRQAKEEPIARRQSQDRMFNSNNNNTYSSKPDVGSRDAESQSTDRKSSVMEGKLEGLKGFACFIALSS